MGFDLGKFAQTEFVPRTADVPVPDLKHFFAEGEDPVWKVRGLNSVELHFATEAEKRNKATDEAMAALARSGDIAKALRAVLGLTKEVPGEIAKRLEMLVLGSVEPAIELPTAVKLSETFPIEFLLITNRIWELTSAGCDVGKPSAASPPTPA